MGQGHPEGDRGTERAANGGGAAVAERAPAKSPPRLDKLPPYRVLLHNDDKNDMLFVVGTLREIAALDRDDAVRVMVEAHKRGVSLVTSKMLGDFRDDARTRAEFLRFIDVGVGR